MTNLVLVKAAMQKYSILGLRGLDNGHCEKHYRRGRIIAASYDWDADVDCSTRATTKKSSRELVQ